MSDSDGSGRGGGRVAARSWARVDIRARWKSLVVLGVLAGLTGGFALAALSGALRTDTALDRLRSRTNASDAVVFASQSGNFKAPDFGALEQRPEVKALARWMLMFGHLDGDPNGVLFAPSDRQWAGVVDKPVVIEGRMFDPDAADEMVVDEEAVRRGYAKIGQVLNLHLYLLSQEEGPNTVPKGPDLHLEVVGVVRNVQGFVFVPDGSGIVSPGVIARYRNVPEVSFLENAYVQLRDPARDAPALQRDVNKIIGPGTPILDFHEIARRVNTTTTVESSALLLLFLAVAAAGGVLVGLALTRSASVIGSDAGVLRAVGMTRREMTLAATLPHALAAGVAALFGVATAVIASRWFPLGVAGGIDPDRGVRADWPVLVPGIVVLVLLVLGGAALVARRSSRSAGGSVRSHSGVARWVRKNAPATVGVGASMALESGAGRARVAVRPALIGAMVGVLGVTAALTINRGLRDALAHPDRAGVTWDATVQPADSDITETGLRQSMLDRARGAPDVATAALVSRDLVQVNGAGVPTFMLRPIGKVNGEPIGLTLTSGRVPRAKDEGAIGPATAKELGVRVGDTIRVGTAHREVKIVGEALFPTDVHAGFDQGLWLSEAGFGAVANPVNIEEQTGPARFVAVRFEPDAPAEAATEQLTKTMGDTVAFVGPADVPVELTNLRNVRTLPLVLAVFLALLAVAAAAHALMTSARVRGREFAILRSLGLTRRGMRSVLNSQATTIAVIGLIIGVPLGVILGRVAWAMVTGRVPLENIPPMPAIGVAILLPCVVLIAVVIALLPSRRVTRLQPGQVLRTEQRGALHAPDLLSYIAAMGAAATQDALSYFVEPAPMTAIDDDRFGWALEGLDGDPKAMADAVREVLIHRDWAPVLGVSFPDERMQDQHIRPVNHVVGRVLELQNDTFSTARALPDRMVGVCRHYAVLYAALLRRQGTPARARVGFARYFDNSWVDHWITERWDGHWVRDDAQIGPEARAALSLQFDPADQPPGEFLTGSEAWLRCRSGEEDPQQFGIFDMHGLWFVRGDLFLDFAALNKVELLPWDAWDPRGADWDPQAAELEAVDDLARAIVADDLDEIHRRYADTRVPRHITSFIDGVPTPADLGDLVETPS